MSKCLLLSVSILLSILLLIPAVFVFVSGAEEDSGNAGEDGRQKRSVPNWAMTSDDFFGWIEELRKHAGYEHIEELARTFWAHFPSADRLGYGVQEPEE
ncbi:otospiralin-like [Halichoeres trimaculatus]|uniref:otospiralin-like n=1 Tax=Halichoeres trimaculatus TaxID=147232 RepID=UPI003D9DDAAC